MDQKRQINEEMVVLVRSLTVNDQLTMSAMVPEIYFIREWKLWHVVAFYMRKYFEKHYSDQLRKFRQNITRQGGELDAKSSGTS